MRVPLCPALIKKCDHSKQTMNSAIKQAMMPRCLQHLLFIETETIKREEEADRAREQSTEAKAWLVSEWEVACSSHQVPSNWESQQWFISWADLASDLDVCATQREGSAASPISICRFGCYGSGWTEHLLTATKLQSLHSNWGLATSCKPEIDCQFRCNSNLWFSQSAFANPWIAVSSEPSHIFCWGLCNISLH